MAVPDRPFYPTNPFTILELQNPSHDIPELHKIRWSPDLEALKLWKGSSGIILKPQNSLHNVSELLEIRR